jgi:hypothetical protein
LLFCITLQQQGDSEPPFPFQLLAHPEDIYKKKSKYRLSKTQKDIEERKKKS